MSVNVYRVGAIQWLILGLLAQSPGRSLPWSGLYGHLYRVGIKAQHDRTMGALIARGSVETFGDGAVYHLTEYGALAHRQKGRDGCPFFVPLDDDWQAARFQRSASSNALKGA